MLFYKEVHFIFAGKFSLYYLRKNDAVEFIDKFSRKDGTSTS
jgi:hypothetical protein